MHGQPGDALRVSLSHRAFESSWAGHVEQANFTKNNPKTAFLGNTNGDSFQCKQRSKVKIKAQLEKMNVWKTKKKWFGEKHRGKQVFLFPWLL